MGESDQDRVAGEVGHLSAGRRLAVGIAGALVVGLILWGALHVMIAPIHPDQAAPAGHYGGTCGACHIVSDAARMIEDD